MTSENEIDLTKTIGNCGRFQFFLTVAVHFASIAATCGMMLMVFGMYNPGMSCLDGVSNSSFLSNESVIGYYPLSKTSSQSHGDREIYSNETVWFVNCTAAATTCERWTYRTEDSTLVTEWNLICDLAWVPSILVSIEMAGVLLGSYINGQVCDRYGRKKGLYAFVALHGIFHLIASFSTSWQMCAVMYFFIGVGVGGIFVISFPYPLEFINGWWRGVFSGIPFWSIGFCAFALIVYILRDWRNVHIAIAVISLINLLIGIWTPESVRWLAVSGKVSQAKNVVGRIARLNGRPCPDTSAIDEIALEEKTNMGDHKYTYLDLFRIPSLRSLTIKFGAYWIILAYTYYVLYFSLKALTGNFYLNLIISALLEIPGSIILLPTVNRLGRRYSSLVFVVIEAACCFALVLITFVTSGDSKERAILCLALFFKIANMSSNCIALVYSPELFPTVVRNIHYGFLNGASRIGAILSPYLAPDNQNDMYIGFIVIGILGLVRIGIICSLPETKGRIMKDTAYSGNVKMKDTAYSGNVKMKTRYANV